MHEVRPSADLDIAFNRRSLEAFEEPTGIDIGAQAIPLATDDRYRGTHESWVIREFACPGGGDVGPWARRHLHTGWHSRSAFEIRIEVTLAPFVEVLARQPRRFATWDILGKPVPLILKGNTTMPGMLASPLS